MNDRMIEFRIKGPINSMPGETVLMRVSMIMCLFPAHCQVRFDGGYVFDVFEEDFPSVERAFRGMYPVFSTQQSPLSLSGMI